VSGVALVAATSWFFYERLAFVPKMHGRSHTSSKTYDVFAWAKIGLQYIVGSDDGENKQSPGIVKNAMALSTHHITGQPNKRTENALVGAQPTIWPRAIFDFHRECIVEEPEQAEASNLPVPTTATSSMSFVPKIHPNVWRMRIMRDFSDHNEAIVDAQFSPGGQYIITAA
jgi:hypothetical protein